VRRIAMLVVPLAAAVLAAVPAASPALAAAVPAGTGLEPRRPGPDSLVYRESAVIAAPAARVWQAMVDLDGYQTWNPWLIKAEGQVRPGSTVNAKVVLGEHTIRTSHIVLTVEPERRLCWRDSGWPALFVYGQRCRTLEPRADGTVLFRQELLIDGPLNGLVKATVGKSLRDGLAAETAALKRRAEYR
jgi:uncharacterized protein YndB with AHSA1/START domain